MELMVFPEFCAGGRLCEYSRICKLRRSLLDVLLNTLIMNLPLARPKPNQNKKWLSSSPFLPLSNSLPLWNSVFFWHCAVIVLEEHFRLFNSSFCSK